MKVKTVLVVLMLMFCSVFAGCTGAGGGGNTLPNNPTNSKFNSTPQISIVAELGENILGYPNVTAQITNNSEKDIAALRFYVQYYDVYGDITTNYIDANKLSCDNTILSGASYTGVWQFYNEKIKSVDLYIYSIYYADGSEWGDKDATKSTILNNGYKIQVV
ncbi:MAG: hypothetical protein J6Q52_03610 [Clostridia bacterium]|nr:hypothetical protein [Clostridia bacterium]